MAVPGEGPLPLRGGRDLITLGAPFVRHWFEPGADRLAPAGAPVQPPVWLMWRETWPSAFCRE